MWDLIVSRIAKRRKKYRIEIRASEAREPGKISGLGQRPREFWVTSAAEGGLSKILTNYGSTRRAKLRKVVCVHYAHIFFRRGVEYKGRRETHTM